MKKIFFFIAFILTVGNGFSQTITYKGCPFIFDDNTFTFNKVSTDATGRDVYETTPIDGAQESSQLGSCELRIAWNNGKSRWELLADEGDGTFTAPYLIYYNASASKPNPPSLNLGTWVENGAITSNSCGGSMSASNTTLTGTGIQNTLNEPPAITAHPSNRTICNGSNTTFSVTANNAVNYQWQVDTGSGFVNIVDGGVYSNAATSTLIITGATAAMNNYKYRNVVTNSDGSATSNAATLTVSSITLSGSQTNVFCNNASNGTATVTASGGTAPYTYVWSPSGGSAPTASGLAAGFYTVTVTDNIGCSATKSFTITQPTALTATTSKTDVSCNGGSNGTATVTASGGTAPYTYSWAPSGGTAATATGLSAGNYTVTITDVNGCQIQKTVTVTQPTALTASTSKTDVSCNGGSNGTATVTTSGGTPSYTYSWAPSGGTAATATGLQAGNYTVTITDANGCQILKSVTINQPAALTAPTAASPQNFSNAVSTIANLQATIDDGNTLNWYDVQTGGSPLANTTTLENGKTYYGSQSNTNGCESPRTSVLVSITTDIQKNKTDVLSISPNPLTKGRKLTVKGLNDSFIIDMFDSNGKKVKTYKVLSNEMDIDVSTLLSGIYLLRTNDGKLGKVVIK